MKLEEYTPDAVCRVMGLASLDPGAIKGGWLARVLLRPSFDPEVCVTIAAPTLERCSAEVRVPSSQVWSTGLTPQSIWVGTTHLNADFAARLYDQLCQPRPEPAGMAVTIDGMSFSAILRTAVASREIDGHVPCEPRDAWLAELLRTLHAGTKDPGCSRGLALAARYLGADDLAVPEMSAMPPTVCLGILGTPDERQDVARAINAVRARRRIPGE